MKRKILGLLICTLMLATIPLAAGMSENQEPVTLQTKKTFVFGVIGFSRISGGGRYITFFALNVRYWTFGSGDHGLYRLQLVRFPNQFTGFLTAPLIFGVFDGTPL